MRLYADSKKEAARMKGASGPNSKKKSSKVTLKSHSKPKPRTTQEWRKLKKEEFTKPK